jgi:hypothetical protein
VQNVAFGCLAPHPLRFVENNLITSHLLLLIVSENALNKNTDFAKFLYGAASVGPTRIEVQCPAVSLQFLY